MPPSGTWMKIQELDLLVWGLSQVCSLQARPMLTLVRGYQGSLPLLCNTISLYAGVMFLLHYYFPRFIFNICYAYQVLHLFFFSSIPYIISPLCALTLTLSNNILFVLPFYLFV